MTLSGCQWGSGNLNISGDLQVYKQFVGCPNARSSLAATSDGDTTTVGGATVTPSATGGASVGGNLDAAATLVAALAANDECTGVLREQPSVVTTNEDEAVEE